MKKWIIYIIAALFAAGAWAHQYEATVDGVTWYYNVRNGEAEITYRGSTYDTYSNEYSGSLTIPSSLGGYRVALIGEYAFYNCSSLEAVVISEGVKEIGCRAFSECTSLKYVKLPTTLSLLECAVFAGCNRLEIVWFTGSAPAITGNLYEGVSSEAALTTYCNCGNWYAYYNWDLYSSIIIDNQGSVIFTTLGGGNVINNQGSVVVLPYQEDYTTEVGVFYGFPLKCAVAVYFNLNAGKETIITSGNVVNNQGSVVTSPTTSIISSTTSTSTRTLMSRLPNRSIGDMPNISKVGCVLKEWSFEGEPINENWVVPDVATVTIDAVWGFDYDNLSISVRDVLDAIDEKSPDSLRLLAEELDKGNITISREEASIILRWAVEQVDAMPNRGKYLDMLMNSVFDQVGAFTGDEVDGVVREILRNIPMENWVDYINANKHLSLNVVAYTLIDSCVRNIKRNPNSFSLGINIAKEIRIVAGDSIPSVVYATIAEQFTDLSIGEEDFCAESLNDLVKLYEFFCDEIPNSVKAAFAEKLTDAFFAQGIVNNEELLALSKVYEMFDPAIPDSVKQILALRISESCISKLTINDGAREALKILSGADAFNADEYVASIEGAFAKIERQEELLNIRDLVDSGTANIAYECDRYKVYELHKEVTDDDVLNEKQTLYWIYIDGEYYRFKDNFRFEMPNGHYENGVVWCYDDEDMYIEIKQALPRYSYNGKSAYSIYNIDNLIVPFQIDGRRVMYVYENAFDHICGIKRLTIRGDICSGLWCMFSETDFPEEVEIANGTKTLRDGFFEECAWVKQVVLPNSLVVIDRNAFYNCSSLEAVVIPSKVAAIGENAFYGCGSLREVEFKGDAPNIGDGAFFGVPMRTVIKVPEGSIGWNSDFTEELPKSWNGHMIVHSGDVVSPPEITQGMGSSNVSCVIVTNVVVHYVSNSVQPEFAKPVSDDTGFVNVIAEVKGNNVAVPQTWAENYPDFAAKFGSDFTKALTAKSGKIAAGGREMLVWEDYVAGTDPTDPNDKFTASVTIVDGKPVVSYAPELDPSRAALRKYTTYGKVKLSDAEWTVVSEGHEADYNFFKVTVEMK